MFGINVADMVFTAKIKTDSWSGNPTFYGRYLAGYSDNIAVRIGNTVDLLSNGDYIGMDASKSYNLNTFYQIKLSMSGTRIKFKIW